MSKLAELIEKFCPTGVEYKRLNEIAHYAKKGLTLPKSMKILM